MKNHEPLNRDSLIYTAHRIEKRIQLKGLERYDPSDVSSHPLLRLTESGCLRSVWTGLRVIEILFPITLRKLLNIRKTLAPTTFWHLIQSYLNLSEAGCGIEFNATERLTNLCNLVIESAEDCTHLCWSHPYGIHGAKWRNKSFLKDPSFPISCAHNTARLGLALIRAGRFLNNPSLIESGISAARSCITYHNWHWYDSGRSCAVSYYPDTDDEVINTGAEIAVLLSEAYAISKDYSFAEHARGLFQMIISEQEKDGGWRYCTNAHEKRHGPSSVPDNHHNAMVIGAMANSIIRHSVLIENLDDARKAVIKGINFYFKNLSTDNGFCLLLANQKREANIAGYCEGLLALQKVYAAFVKLEPVIAGDIEKRRQLILETLLKRYLKIHSGRVISQRRLGISYDIDSIRWGSGLMLEAISGELKCHLLNQDKDISNV